MLQVEFSGLVFDNDSRAISLWTLFCYLRHPRTTPSFSDPHQKAGRREKVLSVQLED
jgi:hypothetical protein